MHGIHTKVQEMKRKRCHDTGRNKKKNIIVTCGFCWHMLTQSVTSNIIQLILEQKPHDLLRPAPFSSGSDRLMSQNKDMTYFLLDFVSGEPQKRVSQFTCTHEHRFGTDPGFKGCLFLVPSLPAAPGGSKLPPLYVAPSRLVKRYDVIARRSSSPPCDARHGRRCSH